MEFDNIFTAIQGRLLSAQKSLNFKLVDIIKGKLITIFHLFSYYSNNLIRSSLLDSSKAVQLSVYSS